MNSGSMIDTGELWFVILALGAGSFGFRFVFLGEDMFQNQNIDCR